MRTEFRGESINQIAALLIDRTHSAKLLVMLSDLQQSGTWHIAASQDILKKRNDIVRPFGASEGLDQQGVVWGVRHQFVIKYRGIRAKERQCRPAQSILDNQVD